MCIYVYIYYISVHVLGDFFQKELFMRGLFTNTSFHGKLLGKIYGEGLLYMEELMIRSCQGREGGAL